MGRGGSLEYLGESGIGIWTARSDSFARVRVGRLVEVRPGRLACLADIESLNAAVVGAVRSTGAFGSGAVVCADYRSASPLPSDLADPWSRAMRGVNRSLSRSAILLNPANVTFNLQIQRVVHCAGCNDRRVFTDRQELQEWLDGRLSEAERVALRLFLDGPA